MDEVTELEDLVEELSWALAKVRYARAVIRDVRGDLQRGSEVLEALEEVGSD